MQVARECHVIITTGDSIVDLPVTVYDALQSGMGVHQFPR